MDGRTQHYGEFYGLDDIPTDRPVAVALGNCQAEALRVLLAGAPGLRTVRIPPVHELAAADLPHLSTLLARTQVLLSQPVRPDYRDLPLGTAQVAELLPPEAEVLRWPVIRYAGLHPYQVIVRHPADRSLSPPVVPYHDLRTVAAALDVPREVIAAAPDPGTVQALAQASVAELARREAAQTDVAVSDVLLAAGAGAAHTINHPGNAVMSVLAQRVLAALGEPGAVADPGRDLLGGVRAPLEPAVLTGLGLPDPPRAHWLVDGEALDDGTVRAAQEAFYRADPGWTRAALDRHGDRGRALGLWPARG